MEYPNLKKSHIMISSGFTDWKREPVYLVYSRHRESGLLERANFEAILRELGKSDDGKLPLDVHVVRDRDPLVGWVEHIMIYPDEKELCQKADKILEDLKDYPVVNEDLYSEMEFEEASEIWESLDAEDRAWYLERVGLPVTLAKEDSPPLEVWDLFVRH